MAFAPIEKILEDLRAGRMVVLVDDEQRENEGDLVCAAEHITPDVVNFMTKVARGVLCVALDGEICDRLELAPQSPWNTSSLKTAFTVTVDAHSRHGVTTGVSATDRATTIGLLADPEAAVADFVRPGHINPLRARDGGVLVRTGQTEGGVDLCRLAGLRPAAVIIEIMNDDGSMARRPELERLCEQHDLKMCSIADVIAFRMGRDRLVERFDEAEIETPAGPFRLIAYRSHVDALPHVALVKGRVGQTEIEEPVLVRVHSQNLLGDVFMDVSHPSGRTLRRSMERVVEAGEGAILYLRCEGMGAGLVKQLQTLHLTEDREAARRSVPEEDRPASRFDYGVGSQILRDLGIRRMRLLTDHPMHFHAIEGFGLEIAGFEPVGESDEQARGSDDGCGD